MSIVSDSRPSVRAQFPVARPRRLRRTENLRRMVRETRLSVDALIYPVFVVPGADVQEEISSMPGIMQWPLELIGREAQRIAELGIPGLLLFGVPNEKDAVGSQAYAEHGVIQEAIRRIKDASPETLVITDVCLCEYTSHGHCGVLCETGGRMDLDNDATLPLLAQQCVSHARAGADMVAPSGMLDGMVKTIRAGLDEAGFAWLPIMSYAAKYASGFYGPFRDAAESPPQFGDRNSYQMDPANSDEALREVALDLSEGADIIMVKPALAYLDIIRRVKDRFGVPLAAYNVSGDFGLAIKDQG